MLGKPDPAGPAWTMEEWIQPPADQRARTKLQQDDPAEYDALTAEIMAELLGMTPEAALAFAITHCPPRKRVPRVQS